MKVKQKLIINNIQEAIKYCRKRILSIIDEFYEYGVLSETYNKLIDYEQFCIFTKFLFEKFYDESICQNLFLLLINFNQFDYNKINDLDNDKEEILKSGKIKIKDLVCCFIIMENGEKDEKLKFLFELYDSDSNGFLDTKEVEYIIDRCIVVARYLGWDVKEIRPIIKKMIKSMDVNNDGMIKLDEWMKCGSETVPLLVLLGLEENMKDDGSHVWKLEHIKNNRICHVCEKYIDGFRKQAFVCKFCKYTSHDMCISNEAKNCIITYFKEIATKKSMAHHWVKGHYKNKCDACGKRLKNQLKCHACSWCNRQIHIDCTEMIHETCDLGDMSEMILSPAHVYPSYLNENHQSTCQIDSLNLEISNELTSEPVIVFINQKSGGQQGEKLHKKFIELLNPRQIFMIEKSPLQGLQFVKKISKASILICGGDGTIGWIMDTMDNEGMLEKYPIAILPLGTGNDLSRVLNWGGGYENENLKKLMKNIKNSAEIIHLDRWSIYNFDSEKKMDINDCEDSEEFEKPGENTKIPYNIINNYFSIGVDASIAQKFHMKREKNPKKFKSRTMNKFFYFEYGTLESLINSCKNLHEHIELQCDNVDINLKDGPSLEGLTILNIPSIYGGTDIWNESKNKSKISQFKNSLATGHQELKYKQQDIGDGKMEIVGITGAIHAGQIRTGLSKSGRRIAQCSKIEIRTKKTFPMQIDGEPWSQKPTLIKIHFKNSGLMYKKLNKAQIDS